MSTVPSSDSLTNMVTDVVSYTLDLTFTNFVVGGSSSSTSTPDLSVVKNTQNHLSFDPYAHVQPSIRQPVSLLMNGRTMAIYYPNNFKSGDDVMHWLRLKLFSFDSNNAEALEKLEWEKTEIHCFWVAGFMTVVLLAVRSIIFWLLDSHARRTVRDPREDKLHELAPSELSTLKKSKELLVKKYIKYLWHGIAYLIMFLWGTRILYLAPWSILNTSPNHTFRYMSVGWPHHNDRYDYPELMDEFAVFTMLQLSWYLAGGVENILHDRSRADFWMMMLHHFLTILLIYGAFVCDAHRCAVHITVTLDIGDITMYYCKSYHLRTSNFEGKARSGYTFRHLAHLAVLTAIWWLTRLYFYGLEIATMWVHNPFYGPVSPCPFVGTYLKIFLSVLYVLQFAWGVALLKMVIDQARKGEFTDNVSGDTAKVQDMERRNTQKMLSESRRASAAVENNLVPSKANTIDSKTILNLDKVQTNQSDTTTAESSQTASLRTGDLSPDDLTPDDSLSSDDTAVADIEFCTSSNGTTGIVGEVSNSSTVVDSDSGTVRRRM